MQSAGIEEYRLPDIIPEVYYVRNFISEKDESLIMENIYSASPIRWTNLSNRRLQNWGGTPHVKGMVEESMPQWLLDVCAKVSKLELYNGKSPNHVLINEYSAGQGIMPHTDGPLYYPTVAIISLSGGCLLDFSKPYREKGDVACGTVNCKDETEDAMLSSRIHQQHCDSIPADLEDYSAESRRVGSVYLERRSLIVFRDTAYTDHLHGIKEVLVDSIDSKVVNFKQCQLEVGTEVARDKMRVSMTIRVVPKTLKASKIFGRVR